MSEIVDIEKLCDDFSSKNTITNEEENKNIKLESEQAEQSEIVNERTEVQAHGFTWEKELLINVYKATADELKKIGYTNKIDLPIELNRLDNCNLSIKTSGNPRAVCMGDCLRVFDAINSNKPIHMVVVNYKQYNLKKKVVKIIEVNLTSSSELLFGKITRSQIEELDKVIKLVPQKRKPTDNEYNNMYSIRDKLQEISGAIHFDIKCNTQQSRLQCSFNRFHKFIENNPSKVIATSNTNEFRGGQISNEIKSPRRYFNK